MTLTEASLLFSTALLGGVINAVAGGGTIVTLPMLVAMGLPPLAANATSAVAFWPGLLSAAWGYRSRLRALGPLLLLWFGLASLVGGVLGSGLLLITPATVFAKALPFLMLAAMLLFYFGPALARHPALAVAPAPNRTRDGLVQMILGLMIGYFQAGAGVVVMAGLRFCGLADLQVMNAVKILVGLAASGVAILALAGGGLVSWNHAPVMILGALLGGRLGAAIAQKLSAGTIRGVVLLFGGAMTVWIFAATFHLGGA